MVYVMLADGFEEVEALTVVDYLRRAGISLATVGVTGGVVTGAHDIPVTADCLLAEISPQEAEMIVLPGGGLGTEHLKKSSEVRSAVKECYEAGGFIAAICAAPSVLGEMGLLSGKQAVCYPGFEGALHGATLSTQPVVRDGRLITAKAAGAAARFAYELISVLTDRERAEQIRGQVYDC